MNRKIELTKREIGYLITFAGIVIYSVTLLIAIKTWHAGYPQKSVFRSTINFASLILTIGGIVVILLNTDKDAEEVNVFRQNISRRIFLFLSGAFLSIIGGILVKNSSNVSELTGLVVMIIIWGLRITGYIVLFFWFLDLFKKSKKEITTIKTSPLHPTEGIENKTPN